VQPIIVIQYPPNRTLGDLAVTVAFELARTLRQAPRVIAQDIIGALGVIEGVSRVEATPNGYLNFFLDRPAFLAAMIASRPLDVAPQAPADGKTIVEHTAINPNKAAHVGHLRNAALGDTLCRLLRFRGVPIEIQNYIDDTGVQIADVVVGFRELAGKNLDAIRAIADERRFDYYCWDLYARVTEWYEADRTRLEKRRQALRDLEHGGNDTAEIGEFIADRIVRCHLATMDRMNVEYDLLSWEGDILRLKFWARAFDILKQAGAVLLQQTGKLHGCWVMPLEDDGAEEAGAESGAEDELDEEGAEMRAKVIVRSDGTVTYVGKDIAYQFWKFGLLGHDFHYRPFCQQRSGRLLWATSTTAPARSNGIPSPPLFGRASRVYNVIDTRQSYLQKLLRQALVAVNRQDEADRSIHFSYEMVALSPATAKALGYALGDAAGRPFVEVSGRKGLGVKADDLLDRLTEAAAGEVASRHPDLPAEEQQRIATIIATAALRYFMIKYSRGKVIAFDIDEALSFEGESGPYLQYAAVRAANILHKLRERSGIDEAGLARAVTTADPDALASHPDGTELWGLVLEAARLDEVADQAIRTLELSTLAKYSFALAQAFNAFYHRCPVINEERRDVRIWRAAGVSYFRGQMTRALQLMGCEVPPRM
jgi:arginyl-tRNA synthetase